MTSGFQDYTLEGELGRGGMGCVYRARHKPTGALRALKVLTGVPDPEVLARFRREAEALARLGPGAVAVPVHEIRVEGGRCFIVMGFMAGGSLGARLGSQGRLEPLEAIRMASRIARALESCHAAGLVHRDLKPDNVLFDEEGRVRLADFGIVRDLQATVLTETGTVLGTPRYMAPEQLEGKPVDARADIYALGVLLYVLVTGEPPHSGNSLYDLLRAKLSGQRAALPAGMPDGLDAVIGRALAPSPDRRQESARELREELEALLAGAVSAKQEKLPAGPGRALVVAGVGVLLLLGAALAWERLRAPEKMARPDAPAIPRPDATPLDRLPLPGPSPRAAPVTSADGEFALRRAREANPGRDVFLGGDVERVRARMDQLALYLVTAARAGVEGPELGEDLMDYVASGGGNLEIRRQIELLELAFRHNRGARVRAWLGRKLLDAKGSLDRIVELVGPVAGEWTRERDVRAEPRVVLATALLKRHAPGDLERAERIALAQDTDDPHSAEVIELLAQIQLEHANFDGALETTRRLLEATTETTEPANRAKRHTWRGVVLKNKHRLEEALAELDEAVKARPEGWILGERACILARLGDFARADEDLARARVAGVSEENFNRYRDEIESLKRSR
jgi:serine/threonine-protein kinase